MNRVLLVPVIVLFMCSAAGAENRDAVMSGETVNPVGALRAETASGAATATASGVATVTASDPAAAHGTRQNPDGYLRFSRARADTYDMKLDDTRLPIGKMTTVRYFIPPATAQPLPDLEIVDRRSGGLFKRIRTTRYGPNTTIFRAPEVADRWFLRLRHFGKVLDRVPFETFAPPARGALSVSPRRLSAGEKINIEVDLPPGQYLDGPWVGLFTTPQKVDGGAIKAVHKVDSRKIKNRRQSLSLTPPAPGVYEVRLYDRPGWFYVIDAVLIGVECPVGDDLEKNEGKSRLMAGDNLVKRAYECMYKGDYKVSAGLFEAAIKNSPKNASLVLDCAVAYFKWGLEHFPRAEELFRKAIELKPKSFRALYSYGNLLGATGRYEKAIEFFRKAEQINPGSASLQFSFAHAYGLWFNKTHDPACVRLAYEHSKKAVGLSNSERIRLQNDRLKKLAEKLKIRIE